MQSAKHKEANATSKVKPRKQLEAEKREEGLQQSIGSDNKGFAMLEKMGFKPGMTLGKKGSDFLNLAYKNTLSIAITTWWFSVVKNSRRR